MCIVLLLACPYLVCAAVVSNVTGAANTTQLTLKSFNNGAEQILAFERYLWANGSVTDEEFYRVPLNTSGAPAGSLLKLQLDANTSAYTLPPSTALSRILYQSKTLNGTTVPVSAYILWPYAARSQPDGYAVVGWAHGTCGILPECAPSHWKNLCYDFAAPYNLALQGYVVVATDYAGLGVGKDATGKPIVHPWLDNPGHANDVFYSIQAAQSAFKTLSKQFVVVGHSQGGGTAWGAAQRQALSPVPGYLGSVALAPVTKFFDVVQDVEAGGSNADFFWPGINQGVATVFPESDTSAYVTPAGAERLQLLQAAQACIGVQPLILSGSGLLRQEWKSDFYVQAFQNLTGNGGRPIAGPLLVIQGEADETIPAPVTEKWVNRTCELYPDSQLQYVTFPGVSHDVHYPSQSLWLDWIAARFAGTEGVDGCRSATQKSARPLDSYQLGGANFFLVSIAALFKLLS